MIEEPEASNLSNNVNDLPTSSLGLMDKAKILSINNEQLKLIWDKTINERTEYIREHSNRFSDSIILVNIGLFTSMTFLLGQRTSLSDLSKLLLFSLVLSLLSILFELLFKRQNIVINKNRFDEMAKETYSINEKITNLYEINHPTDKELIRDIEKLKGDYLISTNNIGAKYNNKDYINEKFRKYSEVLLIIAVFGVVLIILLESGSIHILKELISKLLVSI